MGGDLRPKAALTVHPFAQPDRLRDEELAELEDEFCKLTCDSTGQGGATQVAPAGSKSLVSSPAEEKPLPAAGQTFLFHGQLIGEVHQQKRGHQQVDLSWNRAGPRYPQAGAGWCELRGTDAYLPFLPSSAVNRPLNLQDQQTFARSVGLKWRRVGRSLQRSCRALRDPALDSLAYEYERDGLYEQAFQLLRRFIQAEGRRATLQRLVEALEENELTSLAEDLLGQAEPEGGQA